MRREIRPLTVDAILFTGGRLLGERFGTLVGIYAVFLVPYALALGNVQGGSAEFVVLACAGLLLTAPVVVALTRAVVDCYLGRNVSIRSAYAAGKGVFLPYYRSYFLSLILACLAVLLLILPVVYVGVLWALIAPVAVVERTFGMQALKRSGELVRDNWWRSLGVLCGALVPMLIASALSVRLNPGVTTGVLDSIAAAYGSTVIVVLYLDLRCRHEDFDLSSLAGSEGGPEPVPLVRDHNAA